MAYHEDKLPKIAASRLLTDGSAILIRRGESGYYPAGDIDPTHFNTQRGITPAQVAAMEIGSMFGWEVPGADPDEKHNAKLTAFTYEGRN